jgi:hypothetical protein
MSNLEGLLHLCGVTTAVAIAYVGLDRVHWDDEKFTENLVKAEKETAEYLFLSHGLEPQVQYSKNDLSVYPVFLTRPKLLVLCHIASIKVPVGWWCWAYFLIVKQTYVPAFKFFRNRWDRRVAIVLALVQIFFFLYLMSLATWEWKTFQLWREFSTTDIVPALYFESATVFLLICFIGALSQQLQGIKKRCKKLMDAVDAKTAKLDERLGDYLRRRRGPRNPPSPPPVVSLGPPPGPPPAPPPALGPPPPPPPALGPPPGR